MSQKRLGDIHESTLKAQVLKAIDFERAPESWNKLFSFPNGERMIFTDARDTNARSFLWHRGAGSSFLPMDDLKPGRIWPAGTPTGDAFRAYLRRWGWIPPSEMEAGVTAAQDNTKTII